MAFDLFLDYISPSLYELILSRHSELPGPDNIGVGGKGAAQKHPQNLLVLSSLPQGLYIGQRNYFLLLFFPLKRRSMTSKQAYRRLAVNQLHVVFMLDSWNSCYRNRSQIHYYTRKDHATMLLMVPCTASQ